MCVTGSNRIADPVERKGPIGIRALRLRPAEDQSVLIDSAQIGRFRFQLKIEFIHRNGAVIDNNLIKLTLLGVRRVVRPNHSCQLVSGPAHAFQAVGHRKAHILVLKRTHIRHQVHRHDIGRKGPVRCHDLNMCP